MDTKVFSTAPDKLSPEDVLFLEACMRTLNAGDRLYGPDMQHIMWTIINVLHVMDQEIDEQTEQATYVEIVRSAAGYGIALLKPTLEDD